MFSQKLSCKYKELAFTWKKSNLYPKFCLLSLNFNVISNFKIFVKTLTTKKHTASPSINVVRGRHKLRFLHFLKFKLLGERNLVNVDLLQNFAAKEKLRVSALLFLKLKWTQIWLGTRHVVCRTWNNCSQRSNHTRVISQFAPYI